MALSLNPELVKQMIRCESVISSVVVHSRGAVVTRRVTVPADTFGECVCVVEGLTPMADPGSVKVSLGTGDGRLIGVRVKTHVPEALAVRGPTVERLEQLRLEYSHMEDQIRQLREREQRWESQSFAPRGRKLLEEKGPQSRMHNALAMGHLASQRRRDLRKHIQDGLDAMERLQRDILQVELDDAQRSAREKMGLGHPTLQAHIQLLDVKNLEWLEISYTVLDAQWWPAYTLYLEDQSRRGRLVVEAAVAQATGEDWEGVTLSLSTAVLHMDARLPELASLRLGRAQRHVPRGYREAPEGLQTLFASYDLRLQELGRPAVIPEPSRSAPPMPVMEPEPMWEEEDGMVEVQERYSSIAQNAFGGAPPPPSGASMSASMPMAPMMASKSMPMRKASGAREMLRASMDRSEGSAAPSAPEQIEPAEAWLNFDELILASNEDSRRGQLTRRGFGQRSSAGNLQPAQNRASIQSLVDPGSSKGHFEYRMDAEGLVNVPADGMLHRIRLREDVTEPKLHWKCVPRAEAAVYREVSVQNPAPFPLLDGPLRVFVDGEMRVQTALRTVDVGGDMRVGLGVDDTFRVARNARVSEDGAGIFGGKRAVEHEITIEIRSSLGFTSRVQVYDRIPVTDDENVDVELLKQEPRATPYDQAELLKPVRGGLKWSVDLGAGATGTIAYSYRITLRSKDEIIGGNRRD